MGTPAGMYHYLKFVCGMSKVIFHKH
eukprot:COSAG01_NODE_62512_length_284_cov_0.832432_1_plen_25_part_10